MRVLLCNANTDREEWLRLRDDYLTGSDLATALGKNPWAIKDHGSAEKARLQLLRDKEAGKRLEPNRKMQYGDYLEDVNMDIFGLWTGRRTRQVRAMVALEGTRLAATLDGLTTGSNVRVDSLWSSGPLPEERDGIGVLEMKNSEIYMLKKWEPDAPEMYQVQLQAQLLVTGLPWGVCCAKLGAADMRAYTYDADAWLQEDILEEVERFWEELEG